MCKFITFSLDYFFNSKFFLICFLHIVFMKRSNNFLSFKIINTICVGHNIFNFLNHKKFLRPLCNKTFWKNVFIFWYSNNITNFEFRIFIINFFNRLNKCAWFYINRFYFSCAMICIIVFINYNSLNLIYQYTLFLILKSCIYKFYFLGF